jgi:carboxylesterase
MELIDPLAAPFLFEGTNGEGVLLLHGFSGTPAHFRMMGSFLNKHGYTVHAPLLAGHGTSLEDMDRTTREDWRESAAEGFETLATACTKVHAVGLSMGGLLSLGLAADRKVASVTTIDTPIKLKDRRMALVDVAKNFKRFMLWSDPEPVPEGEAATYFIQYEGFPLRSASELMHLIGETRRRLGQVDVHTLVIQSKADETVRPVSAEIIAGGVSGLSTIVWLEHSRHNALLDTERSVMNDAVLAHLRSL